MSAQPNPWFVLVGGVNGAGKSTFSQNPNTLRLFLGLSEEEAIDVINPDVVTREILDAEPALDVASANLRAANECEREVRDRIAGQDGHFVIETVLSSDKYKEIVDAAQSGGWRFLLIYVALDSVDESIRRVAHRVRNGGHDVPLEKIRSRWPKSLANLAWFWRRSDAALLVLNPPKFGDPVELARKQRGFTVVYEQATWPHAVAPVLKALEESCGVV